MTTQTQAEPQAKAAYASTYHRDGTVSYWDVYRQQWVRQAASAIPDHVLASMSESERSRIAAMGGAR